MNNFREMIVNWVKSHNVKAHPNADGSLRYEALLDEHFKLIVEYDPLNPQADAIMIVPLLALPYETEKRKLALHAMLQLNHDLIAHQNFTASLNKSDAGEFICLLCPAPALPIEQKAFENILERFLNTAHYVRDRLAPDRAALPPDAQNIRYL